MIKKGFLKGHSNVLQMILRMIDFLVVLSCGMFSYYFSAAYKTYTAAGVQGVPDHYVKVILLASVLVLLLFPLFNVYRVWRGSSTLTEIKYMTMAWLLTGLLLAGLAFVTKSGADFSRHWMGLWFTSTWIILVGSRVLLRIVLSWLRSSGFNHRHIVIVGTGEQAIVVADRLRRSTWFGLEISALFGSYVGQLPPWLQNKELSPMLLSYGNMLMVVAWTRYGFPCRTVKRKPSGKLLLLLMARQPRFVMSPIFLNTS